jgi:hypothetical protein
VNGYSGTEVQKQVLRSLREFYPIKVDETVLIAAVQKQIKEATPEQIARDIRELRDRGLIEETAVRVPFEKEEAYRFKISPSGIEFLQSLEEKGAQIPGTSAKEVEARLVDTYDRIKKDMEGMRQELDNSQKALEKDMKDIRQRMAEHDNVIRTYFVRVIETFGVFVGIFAVVVVAIISTIDVANAQLSGGNAAFALVILVALPLILVIVIVTLLLAIREFVLKMPKS